MKSPAFIESCNVSPSKVRPKMTWNVLRRVLGLILVVAAILKGNELATLPLLGDRWLNARSVLVCLVELEVVLGAWLLIGTAGTLTWVLTFSVWLAFLVTAGHEAASGADSCRCFGRLRFNPWYTASFDLVTVATLILYRPTQRITFAAPSFLKLLIIFIIAASGAAFGVWNLLHYSESQLSGAGFTFADGTVILDPKEWMGRQFALSKYIDVGPKLLQGDWILLLYRYDCDHCQLAVPRYAALVATKGHVAPTQSVALIEIPPYAPIDQSLVIKTSAATWGRLIDSHDWFATTPIALRVQNGIVTRELTGDVAGSPSALLRNDTPQK